MKWYTEVKGVLKVYSKYEMVFETNKKQHIKNGILMRKPKPTPKKTKKKKQNIDNLEKALLWAPPPSQIFFLVWLKTSHRVLYIFILYVYVYLCHPLGTHVLLTKQTRITVSKKHMKKTHGPKTMHNLQNLFL